jgi:hypothetical protein
VLSCLPDMQPTFTDLELKSTEFSHYFVISGSNGTTAGSPEMRERVAQLIHLICPYDSHLTFGFIYVSNMNNFTFFPFLDLFIKSILSFYILI